MYIPAIAGDHRSISVQQIRFVVEVQIVFIYVLSFIKKLLAKSCVY